MDSKLTIIIPFANEKDEVENTVNSIRYYSDNDVDIIVINDASDDNYNYEDCLRKYNVKYVVNERRMGVAASRDIGVNLCKTDFFLLLDAHMRFYETGWVKTIIHELEKDSRALLCAQTKVLKVSDTDHSIVDGEQDGQYLGAYINFYDLIEYLEPQWAYARAKLPVNYNIPIFIPCVLGAGYASSKKYWQYLNGLNGLLSYGSDEVLMSLKVWLEGGRCKLLHNVIIGHIYRISSPFEHHIEKRIYNRLYISYITCPVEYKKKLCAVEQIQHSKDYFEAWLLFYRNFDKIESDKSEFTKKTTTRFYDFEIFNRQRRFQEKESVKTKEKILQKSILYIISRVNLSNDIGFVNGKLGITILLYYYSRYTKNRFISNLADSFLKEITGKISIDTPLNIPSGLLGIGWGLGLLFYNKFIPGDINETLSDFDLKVMEISPSRIRNFDLDYGLGGIIRYVLSRLYYMKYNSDSFFSSDYLNELYIRSKEIVDGEKYNNCPEVYVEYILYYEKKKDIDPPSIYDILALPEWNKFCKLSKDTSLHGLSGMCLEFILTQLSLDNK